MRALIDASLDQTGGGLGTAVFRRAIIASARASVKAPAELADLVSGGRIRKLLQRGGDNAVEAEAVDEVDTAIERSMEDDSGFLSKAISAVETQLSADGNPYLDELITRFEARWREERDA